jgi:hypothetical protein
LCDEQIERDELAQRPQQLGVRAAEPALLCLQHFLVLLARAVRQARLLVILGERVAVRNHSRVGATEAADRVVEPLHLQPSRINGVAEPEVRRRDVVEQRRLLDVEQAEVALADVLRLLERDDGRLVLARLDVRAAERAVVLDQRRRVLALGVDDQIDGLDELVDSRLRLAQLRLHQRERREIGGILRLALLALRGDDPLGRAERRAEIARFHERVAAAAHRRQRRRGGLRPFLFVTGLRVERTRRCPHGKREHDCDGGASPH